MKIVLNKSYGGFSLPKGFKFLYHITTLEEEWAVKRTDERLIDYVGLNDAEVKYDRLTVVEIPDNCTDWELDDYDGFEYIIYVVDGKIHRA